MPMFLPPSLKHLELKWTPFSVWMDHAPFGYDIVAALKPKLLVELGTYRGMSYFAFCQSIRENGLDTLCYAVDTWQGDDHVNLNNPYDPDAFSMVADHNTKYYKDFSYLLKMTFNDAVNLFGDETIDLVHIDGYHTYEAISEDFNNWFPKVRPGGIFLLHDIRARIETSFGVWRFWEECSNQYESFAFNQAFGLGVIRKSGGGPVNDPLLELLFSKDPAEKENLRKLYAIAARLHDAMRAKKCSVPPAHPQVESESAMSEKEDDQDNDSQEDCHIDIPLSGKFLNLMAGTKRKIWKA